MNVVSKLSHNQETVEQNIKQMHGKETSIPNIEMKDQPAREATDDCRILVN